MKTTIVNPQEIIQKKALTILAGAGGSGKTTLALDLCRAAGTVVWLDGDQQMGDLKDKIADLGIDAARFYPLECNPNWREALEYACNHLLPDLVVVDSLEGLVDINDAADVANTLSVLDKLAATHDCTVLVIAHFRKNPPPMIHNLRGSSTLAAQARHIYALHDGDVVRLKGTR